MANLQERQLYCVADPYYYDAPERLRDDSSRWAQTTGPVPEGWRRAENGLWVSLVPAGARMPAQGWKIHLAAVPDDAERILRTTQEVCGRRHVPYKFLRSREALALMADKYMPRASAGKFVTVYPRDDAQFAAVTEELATRLEGARGPYVLSDLRVGKGPVHARYGAFTPRWCPGPGQRPVLALEDAEGRLVPDERGPVFRVPSWITVPEVLRPHLEAREAAVDDDFPYRILEPLHFTNAGGIYLAERHGTGEQVVLREARPHAGLDGAGDDAVTRLHREYEGLSRAQSLDCVPRVHGVRTLWEHHFLVEEYVTGQRLMTAVIERYPLLRARPTAEAVAAYAHWVQDVTARLSRALDALHGLGVAFGDLHPGNVILRPDGSVTLIDFEYAHPAGQRDHPRAGAPARRAPAGTTGAEADRWALRATWLMMLLPLTDFAELEPGRVDFLERLALRRFALPEDAAPPLPAAGRRPPAGPDTTARFAPLTRLFGAGPADTPGGPDRAGTAGPDWSAVRDLLVADLHATARPERADRLFPAGPEVFPAGGHTLAHGAAGVLLALHLSGADVPARWARWLADATHRSLRDRPARSSRGLYDGPYGAALVLDSLGLREEARDVFARTDEADAVAGEGPTDDPGLAAGLAGTALALCRYAQRTGERTHLEAALRIADRLDTRAWQDDDPAGLLHGASGVAVLRLALHRATGDPAHLTPARRALARDIARCVSMPDGTLQVRAGRRHLLYLDGGSGGIALVAREYLRRSGGADAELTAFVRRVRPGCAAEFVREPGLLQGRAGLLAVLAALSEGGAEETALLRERASHLSWAVVLDDRRLRVPGRGLRRYSTALADGTAGLLLAAHHLKAGNAHGLLDSLTLATA